MKTILYHMLALALLISSCKRNDIQPSPLITLSVVNSVINGKAIKINDNLRDSCSIMNYKHFSVLAGNETDIKLYPSSTRSYTYFDQRLITQAGDVYTLLLTGTHTSPETILIKDNIPEYPTQDVINIRLVNLSPGSVPLNLTMGNEPDVKIFSEIGYKHVSEFKTVLFQNPLPTRRNLFQIRDDIGNLLLTYTLPASGSVSQTSSRRRNITIIVKGVMGGTGPDSFGVIVLPHYYIR